MQHNYYLKPKPIQLLGKYQRLRKIANLVNLSSKGKERLEWIIFYYTVGDKNASFTASHFGISRSKFYFWFSRFNERNLKTLEDNPSTPKDRRYWQPDPKTLVRMIKLRKKYIHWSKVKLAVVYRQIYGKHISSWQFQRVIQEFNIYPVRKKDKRKNNGAKKQLISFTLRKNMKNLFSIDTKVLYLFGLKYYILVAVSSTSKLAYARAYSTHSSLAAADFLNKLEYLFGNIGVILTDNGSEFQKYFEEVCRKKNIERYYSRVATPKDNPEVERMIKTLIYEWLDDGNWDSNLNKFNRHLTDFLITYNDIRPHQHLNYLTPLEYAQKHNLLSKRSSSST